MHGLTRFLRFKAANMRETAMNVAVSGKSRSAARAGKPAAKPAAKTAAKTAAVSGKASAKTNTNKPKTKPAAKTVSNPPTKASAKASPQASPKSAPKATMKAAAKPSAKPAPKDAAKAAIKAPEKNSVKSAAKAPVKVTAKAPSTAVPAAKPAPVAAPPRPAEAGKPALAKPAGNGMSARPANANYRHGERPEPPIAPSRMSAKMAKAQEKLFAPGDYVVYPTHGVGQIIGVEDQTVAGMSLRVFAISFENEKMILRVPVEKAKQAGLRAISTRKEMQTALTTLKGRARIKRVIWSRRAQEYEAKINSGSPTSIAEVVRDLHRAPIASARSTKRRLTAWRANWPWSKTSTSRRRPSGSKRCCARPDRAEPRPAAVNLPWP